METKKTDWIWLCLWGVFCGFYFGLRAKNTDHAITTADIIKWLPLFVGVSGVFLALRSLIRLVYAYQVSDSVGSQRSSIGLAVGMVLFVLGFVLLPTLLN